MWYNIRCMKKLLRFLTGYGKETVLAPLFKMLEAAFELLVPFVVAAIIDEGIPAGDTGYVVRMSLILVGLAVVGCVSSITAQYFAARAATGFAARVRRESFRHLQALSFTALDRIGTSTLITRLTSDINQVQSGVNLTLRLFLRSPFIVLGAAVMAFTIDTREAMTFVVAIPVLSVVVFGILLLSLPLYGRVQAALDRVLGKTRETLSGARVVRAFNRQQSEIGEFDEANDRLTRLQQRAQRLSAFMNPVTYVIINLAIIALLQSGAVQVNAGTLTQGKVVALVNYMSQILVELIKLANLIIMMTKAVACGNRIQAMLETPVGLPTLPPAPKENDDAVTFDAVSFTYEGAGAPSLTGADFSVRAGETVGIIGGTGSGKSTLVNLIPRFYDATEGRVLVFGQDVRTLDVAQLRSRIGVVPQRAQLFQGTIADNLRWGNPNATDDMLWEALSLAQARDFVEEKPGRLDFAVEQGGKNLSGGQKQRLTIARALVRRPDILILDDSASALDYATDARLRQAIASLPDVTVFIVSQRASSVQHADQILVLDDCAVIAQGTHEALLASCAVYREIYASQFEPEEEVRA